MALGWNFKLARLILKCFYLSMNLITPGDKFNDLVVQIWMPMNVSQVAIFTKIAESL